ncbi:MAG: hypothetical protein HZB38_09945 [Planctomycetes bacterium]|nr:hypothetical protein [Planctomycetota bacterium]
MQTALQSSGKSTPRKGGTLNAWGELVETYQISGAEFNRPSDAPKFDGTSIGLEPGMNIHPQEVRPNEPHGGIKLWDGKRGLSVDAFREARLAGKVEYGPTVKARQANPHNPSTPYMTDEQRAVWMRRMEERERAENRSVPLSEWERYVIEFIAKYRLDQTQTQKAMQILKDCQKRAEEYLDSKKSEIDKLEQEQKKASASGDRNARENARKKLDKLREPVDGIFERELKPRIDKLPTREQRSAAGDTKG